MRNIKDILRLHFEQQLSQRQIFRSINVSQSTVHEYLARFHAADLHWPLDEQWTEHRLEPILFPPGQPPSKPPQRPLPNFDQFRRRLFLSQV